MTELTQRAARFVTLTWRSPGRAMMRLLNVIASRVSSWMIGPASRSGFTASIYFTFFSRRFYREHRAVLAGILANRRSDIAVQESSSELRRNIHRLEKGLIMQPRRPSFAEGYIERTVALYLRAQQANTLDSEELKWAADILEAYFEAVEDTVQIERARGMFAEALRPPKPLKFVPYPSSARRQGTVSYEELLALFNERRSVRWYQRKPVPEEKIDQAVRAASLASSACNRQPYKFLAFHDPGQVAEIARLAGGTAGFADNIPCLIILTGDLSYYSEERDRHLIYIDASLAASQLMLAFQTLGLSTCAINWPDVEAKERELQRVVRLKDFERAVMFIAVGYADPLGLIPSSQKKGSKVLLQHQVDVPT